MMNFPSMSGMPGAAPSGGAPKKGEDPKNITGSFDPTALERAAKALKDLDASPNANKAFEITKLQEHTRQKELNKETEQMAAARAQAQAQQTAIKGEEQRKTISHQQEQERVTAQYKAQLESEAYAKKLQDQKKQNEEWLEMQRRQFMEQEEIRKRTEKDLQVERRASAEHQARLDRELQKERIAQETQGRIQQEKENADVHIRQLRARAAEERKTKIEQIHATLGSIGSAFASTLEDTGRLTAVVGTATALAVGIYGARAGTGVLGRWFERRLGQPPLVRETSRWTLGRGVRDAMYGLFGRSRGTFTEKIVLPEELDSRLTWTTNSLINSKKNGTPFRHLMLYGAPGTGKTLFARTLARESGLDYAIMSGGDVGPLGKDAVNEVNKLFKWANSSRRGLILFVDEADAFLRRGRGTEGGMSEDMRNVLSAFLAHTGTESDKFCVVMATNVRDILDRAVLDRIDDSFEFPLPGLKERSRMISMFMEEYLNKPLKSGKKILIDPSIDEAYLDSVAKSTEGFSGRQLAKLVIGWQSAVLGGSQNMILTKNVADLVLQWKLSHWDDDVDAHERKRDLGISSGSKAASPVKPGTVV
mmetsp:Transcript_7638/g.14885  ORF Transcript_7638/g.14885 Transcript_7638/m.14885 type:complete len:591 (+) Transcript_7638:166-1938(+)